MSAGCLKTHVNHLKEIDYSVLQKCMHCGMCLASCPTYNETRRERNSPRGRVALMRAIADGEMELTREFASEMYYCLGCLACTSACPAGVDYPTLFEAARAQIEEEKALRSPTRVFWRWLTVKFLFMHPRLLRWVGRCMYVYQASGMEALLRKVRFFGLMPEYLMELEPMTPRIQRHFSDTLIRERETPSDKKFTVGFLTGCVQDLAFSNINRDTVDVLLRHGCEVVTPRTQPCCGSLHAHNGEMELARILARQLIDMFDLEKLDAVISNAGGCGSHLRHYGHLLEDDPRYAGKAKLWDRKLKDIHEWLAKIGIQRPSKHGAAERVTYHESCHLCHGQKVSQQPREILQAIPDMEFVELEESSWCCGSAGIYNITQPEQAGKLLTRKLNNIEKTGASIVATANPGCHLQLHNGLRSRGNSAEVVHPISLLARAYRQQTKSDSNHC